MEEQDNACKCGRFKRDKKYIDKEHKKNIALLEQKVELLEKQIKEK